MARLIFFRSELVILARTQIELVEGGRGFHARDGGGIFFQVNVDDAPISNNDPIDARQIFAAVDSRLRGLDIFLLDKSFKRAVAVLIERQNISLLVAQIEAVDVGGEGVAQNFRDANFLRRHLGRFFDGHGIIGGVGCGVRIHLPHRLKIFRLAIENPLVSGVGIVEVGYRAVVA